MGVCQALALFGDAKQAMGEGKRGQVETGLTGPVATALCFNNMVTNTYKLDCPLGCVLFFHSLDVCQIKLELSPSLSPLF